MPKWFKKFTMYDEYMCATLSDSSTTNNVSVTKQKVVEAPRIR